MCFNRPDNQPPKPDQWVELKSPYIGVKSQLTTPVLPTNRANSRFGKIRSRPQTSFEEGIQELDERLLMANLEKSESPTDLQKIKIDINEVLYFGVSIVSQFFKCFLIEFSSFLSYYF